MRKNSIKHHFIPQFFLNNFGVKQNNKKYKIYVYNKNTDTYYSTIVENIAFVKKFHTITLNGKEFDEFETLHNEVFEKRFSKIYANILYKLEVQRKCLDCYNCLSLYYIYLPHLLDVADKMFLSKMLAYFVQRGKKWRVSGEQFYQKAEEMMRMVGAAHGMTDEIKIEANIKDQIGTFEGIKNSQIIGTFEQTYINELGDYFFRHYWNVCFNTGDKLFYTCDNTHALTSLKKMQSAFESVGYVTFGNLVMFPLSPRICILMYDPPFLIKNDLTVIDCNMVELRGKEVDGINEQIILNAVDEVYSNDGDWETLKRAYKKYKIPIGHKPFSIS